MTTQQIAQIDSEYFSEEDVMDIQSKLFENGDIETGEGGGNRTARLVDPLLLAKALDRLVDEIIAEIIEYPSDMLFSDCNGSHRREFEKAIDHATGRN